MAFTKIDDTALRSPEKTEEVKKRIASDAAAADRHDQSVRAQRKAGYFLTQAISARQAHEALLPDLQTATEALAERERAVGEAQRAFEDLERRHAARTAALLEAGNEKAEAARALRAASEKVTRYEDAHPELIRRDVEITTWVDRIDTQTEINVDVPPRPPEYDELLRQCAALQDARREAGARSSALWEEVFELVPDVSTREVAYQLAGQRRDEAQAEVVRLTRAVETALAVRQEAEAAAAEAEKVAKGVPLEGAFKTPESAPPAAGLFDPFDDLVAEIKAATERMRSPGLPDPAMGGALDGFDSRRTPLADTLSQVRKLEGSAEDAPRMLGQLADLAGALNRLADDVATFESDTLVPARVAALLERAKASFDAVPGDGYFWRAEVKAANEAFESFVRGKDPTDWPAVDTAAADKIGKLLARIQTNLDAEELRRDNQRLKADAHKKFIDETRAVREKNPTFLRKQVGALLGQIRDDSISETEFKSTCADLKKRLLGEAHAREQKRRHDRGEFYYEDEWRAKLSMNRTSGYRMVYSEHIQGPGGISYEMHFRISYDALETDTEDIDLVGASAKDVFEELFVTPISRPNRCHATFSVPGTDNAHLFLGNDTLFREFLIPAPIRSAVRSRLEAMRERFVTEKTGVIRPLLL